MGASGAIGKHARVPENTYKYFIIMRGMLYVSEVNGREISVIQKLEYCTEKLGW